MELYSFGDYQGPVREERAAADATLIGTDKAARHLPLDRSRPVVPSFIRGQESLLLTGEVKAEFDECCVNCGQPAFVPVLAALQVLLWRYTARDEVVVDTLIRNGVQQHFGRATGPSAGLVPLRVQVHGDMTVSQCLAGVTETFESRPPVTRAPGHSGDPRQVASPTLTPSSDVALVMEGPATGDGPEVLSHDELADVEAELLRYHLVLTVSCEEDSLRLTADYATDVLEPGTVLRVLDHYQRMLGEILRRPDCLLSQLSLVSAEESETLLCRWNETEQELPAARRLHQLIEAQCELTPERVAIVCDGESLSYGELNIRANQVAHLLRGRGAGAETLVGVAVPRSLELVVALLGVLKAGAAYLVVDPSLPEKRRELILADARADVTIVLDSVSAGKCPTPAVDLSAERDQIALQPAGNPDAPGDAASLAYVVYTSGSTGRPKGVLVEHRAVVNFLAAMRNEPGMKQSDVLLAVTTPSFDIAVLELFLPLVVGAAVIMATAEDVLDGERLGSLIIRHDVTMLQATPATWWMLLNSGWEGRKGLVALCGGEALPRSLARELQGRVSLLYNLYGPSETTVWSTLHRVERNEAPLLIGRPVANTRVYVLDGHMRPVPIGIPGELYISGAGLARGYLGRPGETAERFVPDKFSASGGRLYRTGDQVRFKPNGELEYLGRLDNQVKIRGHRIEPGEVEAALEQCAGVTRAIVTARVGASGEHHLVGYVVAEPGRVPNFGELRSFLRSQLPEIMVPAFFVRVDELPLTSSGKVDRAALPAPGTETPAIRDVQEWPSTVTERVIAGIWAETLGATQVGATENFFDLGGSSLLLAAVCAGLRARLGRDLSPADLIQRPTVRALADWLDQREHPWISPTPDPRRAAATGTADAIAVIGLACRLPGAADAQEFWRNLRDGVESITFFDDEQLLAAGVPPERLADPSYVKAAPVIEAFDRFDASLFSITPAEAELTDPQHRLFLECAWAALENAAYDAGRFAGRIGVYGGEHEHLLRLQCSPTADEFQEH